MLRKIFKQMRIKGHLKGKLIQFNDSFKKNFLNKNKETKHAMHLSHNFKNHFVITVIEK